jgi:hypothetical protein
MLIMGSTIYNIKESKVYNFSANQAVVFLYLFSMPFWSLPFVPGTYASITPFLSVPFALYYLLLLINRSGRALVLSREVFYLSAAVFFMLFMSLLGYIFNEVGFSVVNFVIGGAGWVFAFSLFFGTLIVLSLISTEKIFSIFKLIACLILVFGIFELSFKLLGFGFINSITQMISGATSSRVILTTSEPSWAVLIILYFSVFYLFHERVSSTSRLIFFVIVAIIFVSTFSLMGFISLLLALVVYQIVENRSWKFLVYSVVAVVIPLIVFRFLPDVDPSTLPYYLSRFYKFAAFSNRLENGILDALLGIDGSFLIRIGYPYVAFNMIMDHPFGVGVGQFGVYFPDYVHLLGSHSFFGTQIPNHILNLNADPRNFLLRVAVEGGVLATVFIFFFLWHQVRTLRSMPSGSERSTCVALFAITLAIMMQFSTPHFSFYWITFALITCVGRRSRNNV